MRILALDGATITSGLAVLQQLDKTISGKDDNRIELIAVRNILLPSGASIPRRLNMFRQAFKDLIDLYDPQYIAIEDLKFNKWAPNFSSLTKVAELIGVAQEVAYEALDRDPILLAASTVRSRIGNTQKKDKKKETRRIINEHFKSDLIKLGFEDMLLKKHEDISDAIALGWTSFGEIKHVD